MALPDFTMRQLLEAGVHFGHQKHRWNPKMAQFIYGIRNNIHIIDLAQTVPMLYRALEAITEAVSNGGRVLFVGTKRQAQEAIAEETVRIIRTYKETGKVPNVVNLATQTPATHLLVVRHRDKPGVLAHVFEYLRVAHLNVQETENIIFDGAQAAVARINLDGAPSPRALDAMQSGNADILDLQLVKLR